MKALVTGINGFVGSHLAEYLLEHTDWQVAGTVYGDLTNIAHLAGRLELHQVELSQMSAAVGVLDETRPDYVIHLAAQAIPSLARHDPWPTLETNIRLQFNMLHAVTKLGLDCRMLVVGSGEEYGLVRPDELPVREDTPLRPLNAYGVSKIAQEMLGLQYHFGFGVPVVVVRPFNHVGPRQSLGFVAPDFARQVAQAEAGLRDPVIEVGNLDVSRDFSDVRDIVHGYYLAITEGQPGEVYNLGSERACSIRDLLDILVSNSGVRMEVKEDAARMRPAGVPVVVSDCSKFRELTGWRTTIPFDDSLADVLDYWRGIVRDGQQGTAGGQ
ncbi:MAG TPA: GDP-mannose 4,6-dehydratase [Anaerolineae bacterium]|nr:GDP-mannose 4,6-dehydratase [Anaerolineae bacterium]